MWNSLVVKVFLEQNKNAIEYRKKKKRKTSLLFESLVNTVFCDCLLPRRRLRAGRRKLRQWVGVGPLSESCPRRPAFPRQDCSDCVSRPARLRKIAPVLTPGDVILEVTFLPEGRRLSLSVPTAHQNRVSAIIFSLASEWVVSTGHDKCISWMCTQNGDVLGRHFFTSWASCLQYPSEGPELASLPQ